MGIRAAVLNPWLGFCLAAAALIYLPRLGTPLIWDDRPTIVFNADLDKDIPLSVFLSPAYFNFSREETWRPAATLSYYAMIRTAGKNSFALRSLMLLLHCVNACLLAFFLRSAGLTQASAAAAALFFAHPAHIETLMCVSFNEEILAALGILTMLIAHQRRRFALAAAGLALAVLSKETGLMGLPLTALYDWLVSKNLKRNRGAFVLYAAVACAYLWTRFIALPGPGAVSGLSQFVPATHRAFFAAQGLLVAARVFLIPAFLRIEYFALPPATRAAWLASILAAASGAALLLAAARKFYRTRKELFFFLLWPLPFLALTCNLVPTGVLSLRLMAERWLYLPSLGAAALVAALLASRPKWIIALLLFWTTLGWGRMRDWKSETRLWESLVEIYPWCAKAHEGLGQARFRAGNYPEALDSFSQSRDLRDHRQDLVLAYYAPMTHEIGWESASLYRWLGLTDLELGKPRASEEMFVKAVALEPSDGFSYRVLAYLTAARKDFPSAQAWLDKGLRHDPNDYFLLKLKPDVVKKKLSFQARFS